MAEVRKRKEIEDYKIDEAEFHKENKKKKNTQKKQKKSSDKVVVKDNGKKKSLWVKFRIFCHGVKSEFKKVHWPSKKDMVKYSLATVIFIVFCSLFFYAIDIIFALIQSLFR